MNLLKDVENGSHSNSKKVRDLLYGDRLNLAAININFIQHKFETFSPNSKHFLKGVLWKQSRYCGNIIDHNPPSENLLSPGNLGELIYLPASAKLPISSHRLNYMRKMIFVGPVPNQLYIQEVQHYTRLMRILCSHWSRTIEPPAWVDRICRLCSYWSKKNTFEIQR